MRAVRRKRKLRYGRIVFAIACFVFVGFGLVKILAKPDPYKQYKEVAMELKKSGDKKELMEEISETKMKFLHYPEFEQEAMNQKMLEVVNSLPDVDGISFLDYESKEVLERYITVSFHYQLMDLDQKIQQETVQSFTYHKDNGAEVALSDILRRDYVDLIKEQFLAQANIAIENLDSVSFAIDEQGLTLNADKGHVILPYDSYRPYFKIPGKSIADTTLDVKRDVPIDPNKPMIALTFDDGPSPYTDDFMRVFEENNATASFFMLGKNVENYPDTLKHMVEQGFEVCNHSWDHQNIASDDGAFIRKEIFDTQDAIYRLTGHEPTRIRPPFGSWNDFTHEKANGNGVNITLWNVDTEDWKNRDASLTLERAKAGMRDGAIILFHDLYPTSLEAVQQLVPYLQAEGYQLVTVSDLFKYKGDQTGL